MLDAHGRGAAAARDGDVACIGTADVAAHFTATTAGVTVLAVHRRRERLPYRERRRMRRL